MQGLDFTDKVEIEAPSLHSYLDGFHRSICSGILSYFLASVDSFLTVRLAKCLRVPLFVPVPSGVLQSRFRLQAHNGGGEAVSLYVVNIAATELDEPIHSTLSPGDSL